MGKQMTASSNGETWETAVDSKEKLVRMGGLRSVPKIGVGGTTMGLDAIKKARAIIRATIEEAKSVKEWLMNIQTGFSFVREIDKGIREDGPDFLEVPVDMEEQRPGGTAVTVTRTAREARNISQVKIDAYLNWGEEKEMEALDALDEQLSPEEKEARRDPIVQKLIRRAAHTARWLFKLSEVKILEEIHVLVAGFYQEGYLEQATDQEIKEDERRFHGGDKNHLVRGPKSGLYKLTNDDRFGRMGDDVATVEEIFGKVAEVSQRLQKKEADALQQKENRLKDPEISNMTIADLWEGRQHGNGLCALEWFTKEGRAERRILQVRLDDSDSIWLEDANDDDLMETVESARKEKIRIPLEEFKNEDGGLLFADELPKKKAVGLLEGRQLKLWQDRMKTYNRARSLIHCALEYWVTGARPHPKTQTYESQFQRVKRPPAKPVSPETMRLIEKDLGYKGTISPLEWLVRGELGDAVLAIRWNDGKNVFDALAIRMRRTHKDGKNIISMVNTWHEAQEFFSGLKDKEFEETDRFEGIDMRLGKFLRACWKQTKYPGQ